MDSGLQIDIRLFKAINDLAGDQPWLDMPARLLMNDYFVPTLLAAILLALWFEESNRTIQPSNNQRAVLVATLSAALANILLKLMNLLYFRPRPFAANEVNLLFYHPTDSSFPSNAAVLGFAVAGGVWFYNRSWGLSMVLIAALFGLSRIFGGVHYPLDVIGGAALGWFSALIIYRQRSVLDFTLNSLVRLAGRLSLT